jgi:hypothetical protein
MKSSKTIAIIGAFAALGIGNPSYAGGEHDHKPKHGGMLAEGKAFDAELVAKPDLLTIYVNDHGKPMMTKGMKAKVTLLSGSEKSEAELQPAGDNKLEAKGKFAVAKGTKFVAVLTPEGKTGSTFRFELK